MTSRTLVKETLAAVLLASVIFAPGIVVFAQTAGTAQTSSGKMAIFAWFENKKAALAWYYSQTHQMLVKMGGGSVRPRGPLADVPDDGRPIMAIASVILAQPQDGIPRSGLPPVTQISIELYAPLPGGLAVGGRFAPMSVNVPGLLVTPNPAQPGSK